MSGIQMVNKAPETVKKLNIRNFEILFMKK